MTAASRSDDERAVSKAHLVPDGDFAGTVHSVFASACNLAVRGRLVTVHDATARHTPTSIRVSGAGRAWSPMARIGDAASCRSGILTFGAHVLDLREVPVWAPGPAVAPAPADVVGGLVGEVAELRDHHVAARGIATPGLAGRADDLHAALLARPRGADGVDSAIGRLVGFGPGLTPAGDDLLVGLMAVLVRADAGSAWAAHAVRLVARSVHGQAHRTTDISAHHLRLAAAGRFGEPITRLVDAVAGGASRALVRTRTHDVLRVGASSGADAVSGLLLGLRALLPHFEQKAA